MWFGGGLGFGEGCVFGSSLMDICSSSSSICSTFPFMWFAGGCPAASHFLLLRQKKVTKEKATRSLGPCAWASGNLRCSKSAEFLETSRLCRRRTSKNLFPLPPALLSPARTGGGMNSDSGRVGVCIFLLPPNPWRGGEERREKWIRARACLSAASLHVTPLLPSTAACP